MFAFTWHKPLHPNLKDSGRELEDFLARRRCCTGKVTCCAPILCLKFDWKRRTVVTAEKNGRGGGGLAMAKGGNELMPERSWK